MNFNLHSKSKTITIDNVKLCSNFGKIRGLMFQSKRSSPAMLFQFSHQTKMKIHSFFVFFTFIAVWLDDKNNILEKRLVKPFTSSISPEKPYYKLIEIPINSKYSQVINQLIDLRGSDDGILQKI